MFKQGNTCLYIVGYINKILSSISKKKKKKRKKELTEKFCGVGRRLKGRKDQTVVVLYDLIFGDLGLKEIVDLQTYLVVEGQPK